MTFAPARIAILLAMVMASSGCGLISVTHCTYWNLLPVFGINYTPPVCPGGQPTVSKEVLKNAACQSSLEGCPGPQR